MSFEFNNSIITKRRKGDIADPFISISEAHIITNSTVQLSEIPSSFTKVTVIGNDITWLEQSSGIPSANTYVVDYDINLITFHSSRNGLQLLFNFKGTGMHFIPISMIYTQIDENNNVVQTLGNIVEDGKLAIDAYGGILSAITSAEGSTAIALSTKTALDASNATALSSKTSLDASISLANLRNVRYRKIMGVNY